MYAHVHAHSHTCRHTQIRRDTRIHSQWEIFYFWASGKQNVDETEGTTIHSEMTHPELTSAADQTATFQCLTKIPGMVLSREDPCVCFLCPLLLQVQVQWTGFCWPLLTSTSTSSHCTALLTTLMPSELAWDLYIKRDICFTGLEHEKTLINITQEWQQWKWFVRGLGVLGEVKSSVLSYT